MKKAIDHLRKSSMEGRDEDVARLTPLGYELIGLIGSYDFTFPIQNAVIEEIYGLSAILGRMM